METGTRPTYACAEQVAMAFAAGDHPKGNALFELVASPNTGRAACLRGEGPTLTAARDADGRLTDRRIDDIRPSCREYMCHSPFFKQRCGEPCGQTREQ